MESGKRLVVGIAAHVDAGKTTLAESLMFRSGMIRRAGRVDNKDAFLDTETVEKERGITVFSHIAVLKSGSDTYTLLDTPGHPDFSAETERAFSVLDYCILVISGTDGVQSHTLTLWKLLEKFGIPVFIFINKMDIAHDTPDDILRVLKKRLSDRITLIDSENGYEEELALHSEDMMNEYLDTGSISDSSIADAVLSRTVFPAMCGSALRMTNIDDFLG
ncbi:MAG: GTP-binding protein, partial [Oscillospiraceae bacterium]|nr:GTP-binding protein [Oscillospiraceae bacterium]